MRHMIGWITAGFLLAGCGSARVEQEETTARALPRPDRVLVHDFAFAPDQVVVDAGLGRDVLEARGGQPRTAAELALGRRVADELAGDLVAELRRRGLPAERASGPEPTTGTVLLVKGQFASIDQGNRTERVVVGLGAGRSDVRADMQVYEVQDGRSLEVESAAGSAEGGVRPGLAEGLGLGALTHHLLVATAVSAGLQTVGELEGDDVDKETDRLAARLADEIERLARGHGWLA